MIPRWNSWLCVEVHITYLVGANLWGLQGSPEGTLLQKDMRSSSQVVEDEGRWHGMPG